MRTRQVLGKRSTLTTPRPPMGILTTMQNKELLCRVFAERTADEAQTAGLFLWGYAANDLK